MDNFFTTQISMDRSRPKTTGKIRHLAQTEQGMDAYAKMKLIKSQLKKADEQYRQALSSSKRTRASLDKANRTTQITRVNFLKVYQTKKLRMTEKNLLDQMKEKQRSYHQQCAQKARKIKLQSQLQALLLKNQQEQNLQRLRAKNRKEKQAIKHQSRLRKSQLYQNAKRQYLTVKNAHTQLLVRRKKVESMLQARARHNYMSKINKQIEMLQSYNAMAKQMGELDLLEQEPAQTTKSFFITRQ